MRRTLRSGLLPLLLACCMLGAFPRRDSAAPTGRTVTYHAGWNLVGGPAGTRFAGADGALFTLQAADDGYEVLAAGSPAEEGYGYWAYFPLARAVQLPDGVPSTSVPLPAGHWVLVGNPSGTQSAALRGADAAFTFDPERGYRFTASLQPGQGAWAFSADGAALTLTTLAAATVPSQ